MAFSLVEVVISLIIISLITAAFAPIMSKKLTSSKTAVQNKMSTATCSSIDADCKLCTTTNGVKKCLTCLKKCSVNEYLDAESCSCKPCSSIASNCVSCTSSKCIKCSGGYGLSTSGTSVCTQCTAGKYSEGTTVCKTCPDGTYTSSAGQSACASCPAGYYCTGGIKTACSSGTYSLKNAASCTVCSNGSYTSSSAQSACAVCEAGYYCVNGERTSCSSGQYSLKGSASCIDCPKNHYCATTTTAPAACPSNSYTVGVKKTSANDCICADGFYYQSAISTCIPCPRGSYCASGNKTSCSNDKTTAAAGASTSSECNTCSNGKYLDGNACKDCPDGYFCTNNQKNSCKIFGENCTACTIDGCTNCSDKSVLSNGYCADCKQFGQYCSKCNQSGCLANGGCAFPKHKLYGVNGKNYCHLDLRIANAPNSYSGICYRPAMTPCDDNNGACCWDTTATLGESMQYQLCNYLGAAQLCGNIGSRLPTQEEILSLQNLVTASSEYYNPNLYYAIVKEYSKVCTQKFANVACKSEIGCCPETSVGAPQNGLPYRYWGMGGFLYGFLEGAKVTIYSDSYLTRPLGVRCIKITN